MLAKLVNRTLSVLLSFSVALIIAFILRSIFNFGYVGVLVSLILFSILVSPVFSKIKFTFGYIVEDKYFKFLDKYTKKWIKK